jgi:hypothetical protein
VDEIDRKRRGLDRRERYYHRIGRYWWAFLIFIAVAAAVQVARRDWTRVVALASVIVLALISRSRRFRARQERVFARRHAELDAESDQ